MPLPSVSVPRKTGLPGRRPSGARRVVPAAERRKAALQVAARLSLLALRGLGALALSASLAYGAVHAQRWLLAEARFPLLEVRFEGLQHAADAELLALSGLRLGRNVLTQDVAAAARGIARHPWVASVQLSRHLSGSVVARVREHEAAALVDLGALYAADAQGRLFKRAARADALDLPLLTGLRRSDWAGARAASQRRLELALQLLQAWKAQGLPLSHLSEVRMDADGGLTLFSQRPDEQVLEVRIGSGDFAARLQRLAQVRAALARRGERPVRVELDLVKGGSSWATAQVRR